MSVMTDLEHNILKLRVCFHKRLADRLGLKIDVKRIEELARQRTDEEVFRLIEIEGQKKEQIRPIYSFRMIRIARNSKFLQRLGNPHLIMRLKSFLRR